MNNLNRNQIKMIASILVILLIFIAKIYIDNEKSKSENIDSSENLNEVLTLSQDIKTQDENTTIYVHVCGRVKNPGLINLPANSRVIDAVNAAGGMYDDADIDNINLAKKLNDEDKIYIPVFGENTDSEYISENKKININTADMQMLTSLPGVGEKTAKKIIDYRTKNQFKNIEDIKSVSGFGEKKFNAIKELITVN
ncbi:helix-hairpin-helix domain-containing protein [Peptoniphilus sp. oral taxon 386]|uniref:helix-hairpin-helix domain-containing protein n=1 Tax=Peptoniphilus sp. oral taxon 386 TaxID=652713 RepID=UPI0001DA9BF0|nr:helix-hairpin-helix domain-containing protein [Peptoniphilus sp. oral taxon 386]EFI42595.1 comEA protein [Peptoniphilus sp. oral taxon 386 str. F0131]